MVMAPCRTPAGCRMGACETTPPTMPGTARPPVSHHQRTLPRPPMIVAVRCVKLVRPRRYAAAGAPAGRLLHGDVTRQLRKRSEEQSSQPGRQPLKVTGPDSCALLTREALMGAADGAQCRD